jgi:hypothetical protein
MFPRKLTEICIQLKYYCKIKKRKYQTVGPIPKFYRKIVERDKIYTLNTQIHDRSLSSVGTGTAITNGGFKLVLWAHSFSRK